MLIPTFRIQLNNPVLQGLVTVGKFDGKHPSLACATSTDNILIHSPHTRNDENEHEIRQLSVNQQISALSCGDLGRTQAVEEKRINDILLVGTHTNLLAYDVENNKDIFYKEVPDGVNSLVFGTIPDVPEPLAVVGGNCSIQGFDYEGEEKFWTVTGDNVSALAFRQHEGVSHLLVGSEDNEIHIFQKEVVVCEATECEVVCGLCPIRDTLYGYALKNGTIGVYNNDTRVWHAKSKHKVQAITAFDLDSDGVPELVAGWSNGRVEVRNDQNGELVYKDRFSSKVADVVIADYRMDEQLQIIAVSIDGEIRGYLPAEEDQQGNLMEVSAQDDELAKLFAQKQELLSQLKNYEANVKQLKAGKPGAGNIPPNTKLTVSMKPNKADQSLMLTLATNNETIIKVAAVFCEVIFEEESLIIHPQKPSSSMSISLKPNKNQDTEMLIKAVVGNRSSTQDHVFELNHHLPRFANFVHCSPNEIVQSHSHVRFEVQERTNRVVLWMQTAFIVDNRLESPEQLFAAFYSVRTGEPLLIEFNNGAVTIRCNSMELAGDVVQDLARYLNIENLESVADFPDEMKEFDIVLKRVDEHNTIRLKLSAEIADSSNIVRSLVVKAEDARILNDVRLMAKMYSQLYDLNKELIGEYKKRANNHAELLKTLKDVNQMIQKAARLRCGEHKSAVVAACRKAIKSTKVQSLFKIIQVGHAG